MIEQIMAELKRRGHRMTEQRRQILESILSFKSGRFTTYEVWDKVRVAQPELGLDTIYRNIKLLSELGFLTSIGGVGKEGTRYEVVGLTHHHHVVCMQCGATQCIDYCPVDEALLRLVEERGYDLIRHQLELIGICRKCRQ